MSSGTHSVHTHTQMDTHNPACTHTQMLIYAHSDIKLIWTDRVTGDIVLKHMEFGIYGMYVFKSSPNP